MDIQLNKLRFEKSVTARCAADMRSFLTHLNNKGIDHFGYSKLFEGSKGFTLTTDPDFSELFINRHFHEEAFLSDVDSYESGYFIWEFYPVDSVIMHAAKEYLQLRSGVTLIRADKNSTCEFFYFASKSFDISRMNHIYVNSFDYFEFISDKFVRDCIDLTNYGRENRIIYPGKFDDKLHLQVPHWTNEERSNSCFSEFTKCEKKCFHYLLLGKTATETADILKVSKRTIEKHIENLKQKSGCHTKFELIKKFL